MKTYRFEEVTFTGSEKEVDMLNALFCEHAHKDVIIKFKECRFNHISFNLFTSITSKLYFDDCAFRDTSVRFIHGSEHTVVFKNCKFRSVTNRNVRGENNFPLRITGHVGPKSILRFENCTGLTGDYFTANLFRNSKKGEYDLGVTNPKCTLSYMGLRQVFKDRILSKAKEEVGYKKVNIFKGSLAQNSIGTAIVTLVIPKGVARYGDRHGKCRCQYAIVREITPIPGFMYDASLDIDCVYRSMFDGRFKYEVGKTVTPNEFDLVPGECSYGIHYFYDIKDAMAY